MALQSSTIETMNTFLNNRYYIPIYQREYSWETNELEDFWTDLDDVRESPEKEHFFGQIVVHNDEEHRKKYIIDGQQRTITSTIFMRTLQYFYDVIYKETDNPVADYKKADIASIHIGRYISPSQDDLHLHLGDSDNDYFREAIQLGSPENTEKQEKKSRERMRKAYGFFYKRIKEKLGECHDTQDRVDCLNAYFEAFTEKFQVLYMEATKLDEAFIIFETLNARGKELEMADLLKNFIFSKRGGEIDLAQKQWDSMINKLDKADPTKFIRHYWNSSQDKYAREKELYRDISKKISNPLTSRVLLENLEKYAQCYHDIAFPDESIGFSDVALIKSLAALKLLNAKTFYPIVLAMKQKDFSEMDIRIVVQAIETYMFRNFTICEKGNSKTEVFFTAIARDIYGETLESTDSILCRIKSEIVGDTEFREAFSSWSGAKGKKEIVRYIFRKIHKHLDAHNEINIDNSEIHIEHIMPEDNTLWQVPDETHKEYLWRLGNLALLSGKVNISISNKVFVEKKERYKDSKIEPNKKLSSYIQWTPDEIDARQQELTGYALQIWSK